MRKELACFGLWAAGLGYSRGTYTYCTASFSIHATHHRPPPNFLLLGSFESWAFGKRVDETWKHNLESSVEVEIEVERSLTTYPDLAPLC